MNTTRRERTNEGRNERQEEEEIRGEVSDGLNCIAHEEANKEAAVRKNNRVESTDQRALWSDSERVQSTMNK